MILPNPNKILYQKYIVGKNISQNSRENLFNMKGP